MVLALIEPTIFAAAAVIALVAAVAVALSRARTAAPERGRPGYLGPDATDVETSLRELLGRARGDLGLEDLRGDPGLDELARHHAHWMSVAGRCEGMDDQGRDVEGRRQALYPILAGPIEERIARIDVASNDPERCAEDLLSSAGRDSWLDREFTAGAVGVAAGGGALYCAIVVARRLAVFDDPPVRETSSSLSLTGLLAEAAPAAAGFRVEDPAGEEVAIQQKNEGGRFEVSCQPTAPGEHVVRVGGQVLFVFEFSDHRLS